MQKLENQPTEVAPVPEEKHNLGAKIAIGLGLGGFIGGKFGLIGAVMDVSNFFPKGTPLGEKFKRVFSKDIFPLMSEAVNIQLKKGRNPIIAPFAAAKWSMIFSTVGTVVFSTIAWNRADRLRDSKDAVKHPLKSAKIILGFQEPDPAPEEIKGKYTTAIKAERAAQVEAEPQR